MSTAGKWFVGQEVVVRDVNEIRLRGPETGTVVKVGRALMDVAIGAHRTPRTYRMEDGRRNDNFGHSWVETVEDHATGERRQEMRRALREYGVDFGFGKSPSDERMAALLAACEATA